MFHLLNISVSLPGVRSSTPVKDKGSQFIVIQNQPMFTFEKLELLIFVFPLLQRLIENHFTVFDLIFIVVLLKSISLGCCTTCV